jgi:hypothetical protein
MSQDFSSSDSGRFNISCPNCGHRLIPGEVLCAKCKKGIIWIKGGAALSSSHGTLRKSNENRDNINAIKLTSVSFLCLLFFYLFFSEKTYLRNISIHLKKDHLTKQKEDREVQPLQEDKSLNASIQNVGSNNQSSMVARNSATAGPGPRIESSSFAQTLFSKASSLWSPDGTVERRMTPRTNGDKVTYIEETILHTGMPPGSVEGEYEREMAEYEIRSDGIYLVARTGSNGQRQAMNEKFSPLELPSASSPVRIDNVTWTYKNGSNDFPDGCVIRSVDPIADMEDVSVFCKNHGLVSHQVAGRKLAIRLGEITESKDAQHGASQYASQESIAPPKTDLVVGKTITIEGEFVLHAVKDGQSYAWVKAGEKKDYWKVLVESKLESLVTGLSMGQQVACDCRVTQFSNNERVCQGIGIASDDLGQRHSGIIKSSGGGTSQDASVFIDKSKNAAWVLAVESKRAKAELLKLLREYGKDTSRYDYKAEVALNLCLRGISRSSLSVPELQDPRIETFHLVSVIQGDPVAVMFTGDRTFLEQMCHIPNDATKAHILGRKHLLPVRNLPGIFQLGSDGAGSLNQSSTKSSKVNKRRNR